MKHGPVGLKHAALPAVRRTPYGLQGADARDGDLQVRKMLEHLYRNPPRRPAVYAISQVAEHQPPAARSQSGTLQQAFILQCLSSREVIA